MILHGSLQLLTKDDLYKVISTIVNVAQCIFVESMVMPRHINIKLSEMIVHPSHLPLECSFLSAKMDLSVDLSNGMHIFPPFVKSMYFPHPSFGVKDLNMHAKFSLPPTSL